MITTVVFDLDDTLYKETDYCKSGFEAVSRHLSSKNGYPETKAIFEAIWAEFSEGNYGYAFNKALDKLGMKYSETLIHELIAVYRTHKPNIRLPELSKKVLENLKKKFSLALLTDGFLPAQRLKVETLGIESYFKCIIYTEELGRQFWKPSPMGFEKIAATLRADPATCVYVGDNPIKDFIAPNKLGFFTIQVVNPESVHKSAVHEPADEARYKINSLAELEELLDRLNVSP